MHSVHYTTNKSRLRRDGTKGEEKTKSNIGVKLCTKSKYIYQLMWVHTITHRQGSPVKTSHECQSVIETKVYEIPTNTLETIMNTPNPIQRLMNLTDR